MKSRFPGFLFLLCMLLLTIEVASCQQLIPPKLPSSATPISAIQTPIQAIPQSGTMIPTITPKLTLVWTPTVNPRPPKTLSVFNNLDQSGEWKGYTEGSPEWAIKYISTPSLDGKSLLCSITGGAPYSNLHCYQNLLSEPTADIFELTLSFWFSPVTSCNNQEIISTVQALEFTMNKWYQSKRYEFALQWQNVGDDAPQWRYWNPHEGEKWVALNPAISECLEGQQWHTITIIGSIRDDQVYYESFIVDNRSHEMGLSIPPASVPGEADRLAVAVQLDGNANQAPYDMYIDKMIFTVQSSQP
jgi:hypothetical protein